MERERKNKKDRRDKKIVGLVLAGGLAERMGDCKVLLPLGRRSALERIVTRMRAARVDEILVVTGGHEERIHAETVRLGCRPVYNPAYRSGMFSSILAGVRALPEEAEAFFLLPADTPLVKTATYRALLDVFYGGFGRADVLYPTCRGERGHPPLIGRALVDPILHWSGERGLRGLLETRPCNAQDVPTADRATLLDMDTPEDYSALKRYARNEKFPDDAECDELLEIAGTPERVVRHMRIVARCAMLIADALEREGVRVKRRLLRSACLLHDIAKAHRDHERLGACWLRERGYKKVARIVGSHKDLPERKKLGVAEILYLADKVTDGEAVASLQTRMLKMETRFAHDEEARSGAKRRLARAAAIQKQVEDLTGLHLSAILEPARLYMPEILNDDFQERT